MERGGTIWYRSPRVSNHRFKADFNNGFSCGVILMPGCVRDSANLITTPFFLLFCIAGALVRRSANIRIAAISCTKAREARSARITRRDQIFPWKTRPVRSSGYSNRSLFPSNRLHCRFKPGRRVLQILYLLIRCVSVLSPFTRQEISLLPHFFPGFLAFL